MVSKNSQKFQFNIKSIFMLSHTFKRLCWKPVHVAITLIPEITDTDQINCNLMFHKKDLRLFQRHRWTVQVTTEVAK